MRVPATASLSCAVHDDFAAPQDARLERPAQVRDDILHTRDSLPRGRLVAHERSHGGAGVLEEPAHDCASEEPRGSGNRDGTPGAGHRGGGGARRRGREGGEHSRDAVAHPLRREDARWRHRRRTAGLDRAVKGRGELGQAGIGALAADRTGA